MGSESDLAFWDDIQRRSEDLLESYTNQINRLIEIEQDMTTRLESMSLEDDLLWHNGPPSSPLNLSPIIAVDYDHRVHFDDELYFIDNWEEEPIVPTHLTYDSDGTVRLNYTPLRYVVDEDSDSDTDTLVDEWQDPSRSPYP